MRLLIVPFLMLASACGDSSVQPVANEPVATNENIAEDVSNATETPPLAEVPGAHPTAPEPAPIPAKFRGTWADSKAACADANHHSRITISGRTIRHPDFVMFGESVTASDDQFALKGHFEGTDRPAETQFFINDASNVLTDGGGGGAVRVRCG